MRTEELIVRYGLANEVAEFVRSRCIEISNGVEISFRVHGTGCRNGLPHVPHATGSYDTTRFGELDCYCEGVDGEGVEIIVVKSIAGSAECPSFFKAKVSAVPQESVGAE